MAGVARRRGDPPAGRDGTAGRAAAPGGLQPRRRQRVRSRRGREPRPRAAEPDARSRRPGPARGGRGQRLAVALDDPATRRSAAVPARLAVRRAARGQDRPAGHPAAERQPAGVHRRGRIGQHHALAHRAGPRRRRCRRLDGAGRRQAAGAGAAATGRRARLDGARAARPVRHPARDRRPRPAVRPRQVDPPLRGRRRTDPAGPAVAARLGGPGRGRRLRPVALAGGAPRRAADGIRRGTRLLRSLHPGGPPRRGRTAGAGRGLTGRPRAVRGGPAAGRGSRGDAGRPVVGRRRGPPAPRRGP